MPTPLLSLNSSIRELSRVGDSTASRLQRLGITTVEHLLNHFPTRYEDFRLLTPINALQPDTTVTIRATLDTITSRRSPRKHIILTEALVHDATGSARITWFSQPYLAKSLKPGTTYFFSGKFSADNYGAHLVAPEYDVAAETSNSAGRILPVYPLTANLTQKQIRFLVTYALANIGTVPDPLPEDMRVAEKLPQLAWAWRHIHFPEKPEDADIARKRFAMEELLFLQMILMRSKEHQQQTPAPAIPFDEVATKTFVNKLPFQLTDAQRKAAWAILQDVSKPQPMLRLLEGDVGSGKTVVAAIVMLNAALSGFQSALLCPTEILAEQHVRSLAKLLEHTDVAIGLLTGSQAMLWQHGKGGEITKKQFAEQLAAGHILIAVGTHALLQPKISFAQLALALVDEQHRFGVDQRRALAEKCKQGKPHLLSLSATPIPRSLHLTLYGDLAISQLDQMPSGRKPIITKLVRPNEREATYAFVRKEVAAGNQVFVICPIIEESDTLGVKAATAEASRLQKEVFTDIPVGVLHGKMKSPEKAEALDQFRTFKTPILVATSVIEVGVDIPDATVMIIEGAERFGLAQLHQFRGRIGRRDKQAHCFVFAESWSENTRARLAAFAQYNDGFILAEKDLELRGPGDLSGGRQSGIPLLQIASIADRMLAERARGWAEKLLSNLRAYPELEVKLKYVEERIHFE